MIRSLRLALLAATSSFLLAACGGDERGGGASGGVALQSRDANAPRAEAEVSGAFEYLRYAAEVSGQQPRLCLTFSGALDPATDYSAYVAVDEPVALAVEGSRLCIGGMSFGQTRTVTLRQGLPAADGRTLAAEIVESLSFADRPSMVQFSGDGVILPRIDADGLAIRTVNVETVRVRLTRVNDRALAFRSITTGYSAGDGEWEWLSSEEQPGDVGVRVWEGRMDTPGPANTAVTTVFPLAETIGTLEAGAYFVEVDDVAGLDDGDYDEPARARRWLIVTDLAFTAYRGQDGLDAVVRSLQTANAVRNVRVDLIAQSNEILSSQTTGLDGRVRFDGPLMNGQEGNSPSLLLAYGPEGDFAVLDLRRAPVDLSEQPVSGRARPGLVDGFIYLERGIYRPGETIHASGLLRDLEADAVTDRAGALTLYSPNGLEQASTRFDNAVRAGAVNHDFVLPRAAARGLWRLALSIDGVGVVASRTLQVEDFVPQRVALTLSGDVDTPILAGQTRAVEANARFLYGAPGAGLPVQTVVRVQRDPSAFVEFSGYAFGLHNEQFAEDMFDLPTAIADGAGLAAIVLDPDGRGSESSLPLRLRAVVTVQEPGGRAVSDDVRIPYRPRERYYGLRNVSETGRNPRGEPVRYSALAVNASGEAVNARLDWRLVRIDWNYDWYRSGDSDWRWRRTRRVVPIEEGRVSMDGAAGGEIITAPLDWGSYELILASGNETVASRSFWVGWGGGGESGDDAPDQVQVSGPAVAPQVGDRASIGISAPYAGVAEVVIATDRVIENLTIDVPAEGAQLDLPVTEAWGAGAYVMVSVYTPRDAVTQPRPRRAVGVAYVPVNIEERTFALTLDAPALIEPNQTLQVVVSAESGPVNEGAWVTLAAVDEGILLLTGFQSPDPASWFFGKSRLGVDLLDDYGRLLDPNQGAAAPVRSGGDQIGGAGLSVVPTRTVALFSGPVQMNRQGQATVSLDIPDFNGELRLMAVAWSRTGLGATSQPMTVRDDVAAELILPRFLAPGDQAQATATLDNVDGEPGTYAVTVNATGPVGAASTPLSLDIASGQRRDAGVAISGTAEGIGEISLEVSGPGGFAASSRYPIQVRSPYLPVSRMEQSVLRPGQQFTPSPDALAGYVDGSAALQVSFSLTPVNVTALYESLRLYPYSCTEQIASRVMPLLYAGQIAGLSGEAIPEDSAIIVQTAIETLLARQGSDGAFGLWRMGDGNASPWLGAYATDFLFRAREAGYPVPEAALARALAVMVPIAQGNLWQAGGYDTRTPDRRWSRDTETRLNHRSAAYAMYVLAKAGQADRSRLRYMHDELLPQIESPLARAQIGAALALMGDQARAASAFASAVEVLGYNNAGDWYQTPRRDLAGVLALAAEAGLEDRVIALTARVSQDLPEPARLTTQEKAFLILAARAMAGDNMSVPVSYSGTASDPALVTFDSAGLSSAGTFTNTGDRPLWRTSFARGAPASPPEAASESLMATKTFASTSGDRVDLSQLSQGDRIMIVIDVQSTTQDTTPLIVADLLPAGFEIEAILTGADAGSNGPYAWLGDLAYTNVAEARDDQFVAALDLRNRDNYRLAYIVRAVTPGEFAYPGVVAEDMYRPLVFARTAPGRVTIRP